MINYRILPEKKLIAICNWGKTTVEDIVKFSQDLRSDPGFSQSYDSIVDNTQLESIYTGDEIKKLSNPRIDTSKSVGKVAIIAPADIIYGMSRMHELISETKSPHKIHVFRDTGSALKWLDREGLDIESIFEEIKGKIK
jgi:hypothetical protein